MQVLPMIWSDGLRTAYAFIPDGSSVFQGLRGAWHPVSWEQSIRPDGSPRLIRVTTGSGADTELVVEADTASQLTALAEPQASTEQP